MAEPSRPNPLALVMLAVALLVPLASAGTPVVRHDYEQVEFPDEVGDASMRRADISLGAAWVDPTYLVFVVEMVDPMPLSFDRCSDGQSRLAIDFRFEVYDDQGVPIVQEDAFPVWFVRFLADCTTGSADWYAVLGWCDEACEAEDVDLGDVRFSQANERVQIEIERWRVGVPDDEFARGYSMRDFEVITWTEQWEFADRAPEELGTTSDLHMYAITDPNVGAPIAAQPVDPDDPGGLGAAGVVAVVVGAAGLVVATGGGFMAYRRSKRHAGVAATPPRAGGWITPPPQVSPPAPPTPPRPAGGFIIEPEPAVQTPATPSRPATPPPQAAAAVQWIEEPAETGTLVAGRYELREKIGSGGFGTVHVAYDRSLEREVVVKSLHPYLYSVPELRDNVIREARIAAKIQHPNVVTVYDAPLQDGVVHIVMEYVRGTTLQDLLRTRGALDVKEARRIFIQCTQALEAIHEMGFMHRDLKPANILINIKGRPMLTDLGIARHADEASGLSRTGIQPGTIDYMSPEQARGRRDIDPRSDIYSMGLVYYNALTGRTPHDLSDLTDVEARIKIADEPLDVDAATKGMAPPVIAVLKKALAHDREDRFADAGQMAAAIQAT